MDDLISRQAAISLPVKPREDRYFQTQSLDDAYDYGWRSLQRCIEKLPSAQPRPRGQWLPDNRNYYEDRFVCSVCERSYEVDTCMGDPTWDFCPNCGADMREEDTE